MKANREQKKLTQPIVIWLILFQVTFSFWGATTARSGITNPNIDAQHALNSNADVFKILAVLENKIEDRQLLERTTKKLFALNDSQTRLIASLSDRVAKEGNATEASIAFLLMTALITLL